MSLYIFTYLLQLLLKIFYTKRDFIFLIGPKKLSNPTWRRQHLFRVEIKAIGMHYVCHTVNTLVTIFEYHVMRH